MRKWKVASREQVRRRAPHSNKAEAAVASVSKDMPPFVVAGLKERELAFANSTTLHEIYFANLGGDGKATGELVKSLGDTYGTLGAGRKSSHRRRTRLAGGSGWVILDFDMRTNELRTHWSGNHAQMGAARVPLLVLDMYEHDCHMDYGAAAGEVRRAASAAQSACFVSDEFARVAYDLGSTQWSRCWRASAALPARQNRIDALLEATQARIELERAVGVPQGSLPGTAAQP